METLAIVLSLLGISLQLAAAVDVLRDIRDALAAYKREGGG